MAQASSPCANSPAAGLGCGPPCLPLLWAHVPELATEFLKFVASEDVQRMWAQRLEQVPVNQKAFDVITPEEHPHLAVFVEQMKTAIPRPQTPHYPEIENLMNPEMQAALDNTKSVKAALDAAVAEIDALLNEEM